MNLHRFHAIEQAGPHASGNSSGAANWSSVSSGVASAFFFRGDSEPFGPLGARAALWALRTWWQQGSRASTDRKNAAVARAARDHLVQINASRVQLVECRRRGGEAVDRAGNERNVGGRQGVGR